MPRENMPREPADSDLQGEVLMDPALVNGRRVCCGRARHSAYRINTKYWADANIGAGPPTPSKHPS